MTTKKKNLEVWQNELSDISIPTSETIGVRIDCRILVSDGDWDYVKEILEFGQQYGTAAIVEYVRESDF